MAAYKAKQDDLRRLMKERRENSRVKLGQIESPFANIGQLSCTICNVFIKNNNLWGPHVAGKIHKENLLKPKKNVTNDLHKIAVVGTKRNLDEADSQSAKKIKSGNTQLSEPPQSSKTVALLPSYSSSDESDDNELESENPAPLQNVVNNTLPSDFFDSGVTAVSLTDSTSTNVQSEKPEKVALSSSNVETLPEGFFDDPILDAKARNIEYKDPVEEEWEKFQKTIAEETNVSKTLIEEDLEESTLERDIDQIDEQIQQWERVKNLQVKAEDVMVTAPQKNTNDCESGASDDELEEDDLLDWRSKGVKKL